MASDAPSYRLQEFAGFMNPRGIDLTPFFPQILPAVSSHPKEPRTAFRWAIPDISPGTAVLGYGIVIQGDVSIGRGTSIFERVYLRADKGQKIIREENCDLQDNVKVHVSPTRGTDTIIGNGATLAHNAVCHGAIIGENAFIALNAILNDGCQVGTGTFVDWRCGRS
jgi:carbonic anhydrase/acetyltransferase-like protein (isoleucine patch superfamily)